MTGVGHEHIGEGAVGVGGLLAVVDCLNVEHSADLFRVELGAKEGIVWALHGGDDDVSEGWVGRGRGSREHLGEASISLERLKGDAIVTMIEGHGFSVEEHGVLNVLEHLSCLRVHEEVQGQRQLI